ncbi:YlaI family protein [Aliibacillus thermotolerans]|uniref:YlaI family protein n=1 Tax=Aliibacillus thermotolerans TaxID=1834418 RepID=A0ABW0U556_9BACI|nr:YlaI family protein [Aliibacillus thermotolerans]MDA3131053.1 DUF2197 domain-containing protein [Aliibacillus thermotolerans]
MKVKCMICDTIQTLDDKDPLAKKLRNRPIHTYLCSTCKERITKKTMARHKTGRFQLYHTKKK